LQYATSPSRLHKTFGRGFGVVNQSKQSTSGETREMNNEPVAWIAYDEFGDFMLEATPEGDYPWQPLYTHPSDRIAELEKQIENLKWDVNHREQDIDNLKTRLFDAKRKYDTSTHEYKYSAKYVKELEAKIAELAQSNPLYTHPAKTLTDEEIITCIDESEPDTADMIRFARAILRKAQEK